MKQILLAIIATFLVSSAVFAGSNPSVEVDSLKINGVGGGLTFPDTSVMTTATPIVVDATGQELGTLVTGGTGTVTVYVQQLKKLLSINLLGEIVAVGGSGLVFYTDTNCTSAPYISANDSMSITSAGTNEFIAAMNNTVFKSMTCYSYKSKGVCTTGAVTAGLDITGFISGINVTNQLPFHEPITPPFFFK